MHRLLCNAKLIFFLIFVAGAQAQEMKNRIKIQLPETVRSAPVNVRAAYAVIESLVYVPFREDILKKYTTDDLKRYAKTFFVASDFDGISKARFDKELADSNIRNSRGGNIMTETHIMLEVEKRLSKRTASLVNAAFWIKAVVDSVQDVKYEAPDLPNTTLWEKRVHLRVTRVWKGKKVQVGSSMQAYYFFWNYNFEPPRRGGNYILAIYPVVENFPPYEVKLAIGEDFPIENGMVLDERNVFKLGNTVSLKKFEKALQKEIEEILLWKGVYEK